MKLFLHNFIVRMENLISKLWDNAPKTTHPTWRSQKFIMGQCTKIIEYVIKYKVIKLLPYSNQTF